MSKAGMKIHRWTDEDDAALRDAVEDLEPLADHLREQPGASIKDFWGAVAGRLYERRDITVSGPACSRRVAELRIREEERQAAERAVRARSDLTAEDLAPYEDEWRRAGEIAERAEAGLSDLTASAQAYAQSAAEDARLCRRMLEEVCQQLGVDVHRWAVEG